MTDIVEKTIRACSSTLVVSSRPLPLVNGDRFPDGVRLFFERVESGILFAVDGVGFELGSDRLNHSVNELLGDQPSDREEDYFDHCYVLFHSSVDSAYVVCVDLNAEHSGWIFMAVLGESLRQCSTYRAKSFEEWLEAGLNSYIGEDRSRFFTMRNLPSLGPVGDA